MSTGTERNQTEDAVSAPPEVATEAATLPVVKGSLPRWAPWALARSGCAAGSAAARGPAAAVRRAPDRCPTISRCSTASRIAASASWSRVGVGVRSASASS